MGSSAGRGSGTASVGDAVACRVEMLFVIVAQ
jgi:hypothetical protein